MKARKIIAYIVITLCALFLLAGCNESAEVTEAPTPSRGYHAKPHPSGRFPFLKWMVGDAGLS